MSHRRYQRSLYLLLAPFLLGVTLLVVLPAGLSLRWPDGTNLDWPS